MIKYALPGMYEHAEYYFHLLDFMRQNPNYFYDNIKIEIIYGNPQFCIWDGGRIFEKYIHASKEKIQDIINIYNNEFNIPIRYVFTNCCLTEKEYYNKFGNLLMELGSRGPNEVVVADDNFMKYLKNNYPMYKYVSSTTKCLTNCEQVKNELHKKDYKLICLDYNLNNNLNFLKTFSLEEKEKTEMLINAICGPGCPNRKHHYIKNSQSHLEYGRPYHMGYCAITQTACEKQKHHLDYNLLTNTYEPLGFSYFKIEGRTWNELDLTLTLSDYLIKPEYKNTFISAMLR